MVMYELSELKIACIFDPFTMSCYEGMCKLIKISPDNWRIDLESNRPHMLLVESAWHGNGGQWIKKIKYINKYNISKLQEVINWCKNNKIPTVFWNKEDPAHYEDFIETTKLFDYIFTTDEDSIPRYKNELNHGRVYPLPFAAQPKIHNPIKIYDQRIEKACFAGAFYNNRFPERRRNLQKILRLAIGEIGLDIYDRNYYLKNIEYQYPNEFRQYIKGYLPTNELEKCNKGYKIMLNVNSITNSPTMFSRRVFESLACGTPIVSSYSLGIKKMFNDLVVASNSLGELKEEFIKLKDKDYYEKKVIKGIREVLNNHTYQNRIMFILDKIGIKIYDKKTTVALVSIINNIYDLEQAKLIYYKQEYKYKKLYVLVKNDKLYNEIIKNNEDINIILIDDENKSKYSVFQEDYVSIINLNNHYGNHYIEDLVNASLYTEAEFIGKKTFFKYNEKMFDPLNKKSELYIVNDNLEFQYVDSLDLDKCIVKTKVLSIYKIEELLKEIYKNSIDKFKFGCRCFSTDKYNFSENVNKNNHKDFK